jgi:hypothetical protein
MTPDFFEYPPPPAGGALTVEPPPPTATTAGPDVRSDLRFAAVLVGVLAVLGALLGLVWSAWSGPQQRAYVIAPGKLYPFDEVETMAGADGRYFLLVGAIGLVGGFVVWLRRRGNRGPITVVALALGGLIGALLTWWVGHLTGGGTYHGKPGTTIPQLPLTVHMRGLVLFEPVLALLVYGLFTAFAARDDLGRLDPVRGRLLVQRGQQPEDGGGDGDAAGALQQREFPPQ